MKILIVVPSFKVLGGVSNHYKGLAQYWTEKVKYCFQGKRPNLPAYITLIPDFIIFIFKLLVFNPDIIVINPSLRKYQITRDFIYIRIARLFKKKISVFIHGWDSDYYEKIKSDSKSFCNTLNYCSCIFVLYSDFKIKLKQLGITVPIFLTTTKVEDKLIEQFDISKRNGIIKNLLFLARLEVTKGIYITIDAFNIVKTKHPDLKLIICGSGSQEKNIANYISEHSIKDIEFRGKVSGDDIIHSYCDGDVYILPTYEEGMATSILEAMAFGLPILSRPVGGINDYFIQNKMGILTDSYNAQDYAQIIDKWICNPDSVKNIMRFNHIYACQNFLASSVVSGLEHKLNSI